MRLFLTSLLTLACIGNLSRAAPTTVATYVEAAKEANSKDLPFAVYIHGSSWYPASRLFGEKSGKLWSSLSSF